MSEVKVLRNKSKVEAANELVSVYELDIKKQEALHRLTKNKDFRFLILNDFMVEQTAKNVFKSTNLSLPLESREAALAMAKSASYLKEYLTHVDMQGEYAEGELQNARLELEQSRGED